MVLGTGKRDYLCCTRSVIVGVAPVRLLLKNYSPIHHSPLRPPARPVRASGDPQHPHIKKSNMIRPGGCPGSGRLTHLTASPGYQLTVSSGCVPKGSPRPRASVMLTSAGKNIDPRAAGDFFLYDFVLGGLAQKPELSELAPLCCQ